MSSDGPFHLAPVFCFPKTKLVLARADGSLAGPRNLLSYITAQGIINFYSLCHSGEEDLQSIFSFRGNKREILSLYVKK